MPSYVIVGASRGIGYQYLKTLSKNSSNKVFGLVRTPSSVEDKVKADGLSNVTILPGDLTDTASLNAAASKVSQLTGGFVDYLIVNGAYLSPDSQFISPAGYKGQEAFLLSELNTSMVTNVVGVIYSINAFIDLVKKSNIKKVIVISSGHADVEIFPVAELTGAIPYAISKAGANLIVAKYAVEFKNDGIIFLALSPGFVSTEANDISKFPPERQAEYQRMGQKFLEYDPTFKGPITPEESVEKMLEVIGNITTKESGAFLSHHGDKNWL